MALYIPANYEIGTYCKLWEADLIAAFEGSDHRKELAAVRDTHTPEGWRAVVHGAAEVLRELMAGNYVKNQWVSAETWIETVQGCRASWSGSDYPFKTEILYLVTAAVTGYKPGFEFLCPHLQGYDPEGNDDPRRALYHSQFFGDA